MVRMLIAGVAITAALSLLAATALARNSSGLPTGKRQHKPFTVTQPTDKSGTPKGFKSPTPPTGCLTQSGRKRPC